MHFVAVIATGIAGLVTMSAVHGHGYISDPEAQWSRGYPDNGWGSTVDNEIWGLYDFAKYGYGPNGTLGFFKDTFPTKGYDSLGQFIAKNQKLYSEDVDPDCGWTIYKDSVRSALPAKELTYTGFTHPGPCEIWCDDNKLLFDYDCWTKYPAIPAKVPYDASKCANANRLTIYWIGIHGVPWQIYTDCVWLKGGSGKGEPPSVVGAGASTVFESKSGSTSSITVTPAPMTPSINTRTTPHIRTESLVDTDEASFSSVDDTQVTSTPPATTTEEISSDMESPNTSKMTASTKCTRRN
ncbi:hypothetical protein PHMEG_00018636 [Phytophthora megakarya]|uniref:Uncharacterized protein n=1 Tax=Phytophthora megakarya TaxID=4795 RepID=A0A225VVE2_9STRA|nr:hypothetical protein PHMEG_00018636 [Phytophthora megakarya]